jgi:hypothetical protein
MRAIEAKTFSGYGGLQQIELPKPQPTKERVLGRITAAGVTPLDHTMTRSLRVPRESLNSQRKKLVKADTTDESAVTRFGNTPRGLGVWRPIGERNQ